MSYEPTEWKSGDVVTSEKLNKLENGVAAANVTYAGTTLDEGHLVSVLTVAELWAASQNGIVVLVMPESETVQGRVLMTSASRQWDSHDNVYQYEFNFSFNFSGGYSIIDGSGDENAHPSIDWVDDGSGA